MNLYDAPATKHHRDHNAKANQRSNLSRELVFRFLCFAIAVACLGVLIFVSYFKSHFTAEVFQFIRGGNAERTRVGVSFLAATLAIPLFIAGVVTGTEFGGSARFAWVISNHQIIRFSL